MAFIMTDIRIIHPDAALREALKHTFEAAWNGVTCTDFAPDKAPNDMPDLCIVIGDTKPDFVPEDCFIPLHNDQSPQRLRDMLRNIEAMFRAQNAPASFSIKDASVDTRNREWSQNGQSVPLTEKEVAVLVYLWNASEPVTREDLLRDVWEYAPDADTHTIETHIYRLRQKIEPDPTNPVYVLTEKTGYQIAARSNA